MKSNNALKSINDYSQVRQPVFQHVSHGGELNLSNRGQMELLRALGERGVPLRTMVCGFSMHPFIRNRDVLTIAPLINRPPRTGEVVAFTHPVTGRLVIHRVTAKKGGRWLLRGDNSLKADGLVGSGDILGSVVRVERQGREVTPGIGAGAGSCLIAFLSKHNLLIPGMKLTAYPLRAMRALRTFLKGFPEKSSSGSGK